MEKSHYSTSGVNRQRGFTLVELSIVLVIIGLIVGGILVGQDLISAAQVRAQISQIEKYQTAVNTFRVKYNALPGDIADPNATAFGFAQRGQNAGEGDGNGAIEGVNVDAGGENKGWVVFSGETEMFWVDLTVANLIDGGFSQNNMTGPPGSVTLADVGKYMPAAKIGNGNYVYVWSGGWQIFNGHGDNINYFGLSAVIGENPDEWGSMASNISLTVRQAYAIDSKIDDGLPQSGTVMAMYSAAPINFIQWAAGGPADPIYGEQNFGACDGGNVGPVTTSDNIATPPTADTCYDNGNIPNTLEHYSIGVNGGSGPNCALSFQFQ